MNDNLQANSVVGNGSRRISEEVRVKPLDDGTKTEAENNETLDQETLRYGGWYANSDVVDGTD